MALLFCLSNERIVSGNDSGLCPSPASTIVMLGFLLLPVAANVMRLETLRNFFVGQRTKVSLRFWPGTVAKELSYRVSDTFGCLA